MLRRDFLMRTGLAVGAATLATAKAAHASRLARMPRLTDWSSVRAEFDVLQDHANFAGFFLASHPRPVRDAIETYRKRLDLNPIGEWEDHRHEHDARIAAAAADYLGVEPDDIAFTDSTTMGLGLLYSGLKIRRDQEVLTTEHDHYATWCSIMFAAQRSGVRTIQAPLYDKSWEATRDGVVESITSRITPATRIVAVTWVHSKTGLKFPVRALADAIKPLNEGRDDDDRILLCVDGVHGLGVENVSLPDLGCDFFVAGTHKWIFGPRGTGLVWGRPDAWPHATPTIPPFNTPDTPGHLHTPGGFHSFEHRWAVDEAFAFHRRIGKAEIETRIHDLNRQVREGLASMDHVQMYTPMSDELSAGIACFDVEAIRPQTVVERLAEKRIIASTSPYTPTYARLSAGLLNDEEQIEHALAAVAELG
jgi:selenocysteine lyase/cysteine desulfurase